MSRASDLFYICIIAIDLMTATMVKANDNLEIYQALRTAQETWSKPCYLYSQWIDCSALRNTYIISYPNTRFGPRLFTPRNTLNLPVASVLQYNVQLNKFENLQKVPSHYLYQPQQTTSESVPRQFNINKSSSPSIIATSSEIDNLTKIKKTMSLNEFKQTINPINIHKYPVTQTPVKPLILTAPSGALNVTREYNEMVSKVSESTNEHQDVIGEYNEMVSKVSESTNEHQDVIGVYNEMVSKVSESTNEHQDVIGEYNEMVSKVSESTNEHQDVIGEYNEMVSKVSESTNEHQDVIGVYNEMVSKVSESTNEHQDVIGEYNEMVSKVSESTNEHENEHFLQYSTTTSKDISISNGTSTRRYFFKSEPVLLTRNEILYISFKETLDRLERKFFLSAFTKLTAISPEDRRENGISFLQSGLFLHLLLVSLSTEMDKNVTQEIEECMGLNMTEADKIELIKLVVSWLPVSSDVLKFRWTSRLVLGHSIPVSREFREGAAAALPIRLSWLNGSETSAEITKSLNEMVAADSGGAMHDTFEEEELSSGVCGVALATLYVRGRWRAAPTLLNDSRLFRDAENTPPRYTRLFRINDIVGYAYLHEWDAEAIEISYATPGLTLLMLVPKEPSLRKLVENVTSAGLARVLSVMHQLRAAVTLPLYTLRMTLLLPNKLEDMGMPSMLSTNETECNTLKFSHAVQRLMFWAEAGRNAFKDDGIEWDPRPEMEIVVDRPYLFFVRWHNITLMNGNFVL